MSNTRQCWKQVKHRILLLISLPYCSLANPCLCTSWPVSRNWLSSQMKRAAFFMCDQSHGMRKNRFWCNSQGPESRLKTLWRRSGRPVLMVHWRCRKKLMGLYVVRGDEMGWCELVVGIPVAGITADTGNIWCYCNDVCEVSLRVSGWLWKLKIPSFSLYYCINIVALYIPWTSG